jgi:hypothetical protein
LPVELKEAAVVGIERHDDTITFVRISLTTKIVNIKSYKVEAIEEFDAIWRVKSVVGHRYELASFPCCESLNFDQLGEKLKQFLDGIKYFFIRDHCTLQILKRKMGVDGKNIYFVARKLRPMQTLFCAPCYLKCPCTCVINASMTLAYYLGNVNQESFPGDMKMFSTEKMFHIPIENSVHFYDDEFVTGELDEDCCQASSLFAKAAAADK